MAITYDKEGNILNDGMGTTYSWDAENRLVTVESANSKVENGYDYRNFRIWKKSYSGSPGNWTLDAYTGFIYDGQLVAAEVNLTDDSLVRNYTWGLDPAGTKQQVGGIGALLAQEDSAGNTYYYVNNAGGNVTKLINSTDSSVVNSYEYGPYGQVIAKTETIENPYQYNTKYTDEETGFVYYGYRYYDPKHGRWLNQDPIGVNGGINLYNSVSNNMVNGYSGGWSYSNGMELHVGDLQENHGIDGLGLFVNSEKLAKLSAEIHCEARQVAISNPKKARVSNTSRGTVATIGAWFQLVGSIQYAKKGRGDQK